VAAAVLLAYAAWLARRGAPAGIPAAVAP